jgi:hypothetical protein
VALLPLTFLFRLPGRVAEAFLVGGPWVAGGIWAVGALASIVLAIALWRWEIAVFGVPASLAAALIVFHVTRVFDPEAWRASGGTQGGGGSVDWTPARPPIDYGPAPRTAPPVVPTMPAPPPSPSLPPAPSGPFITYGPRPFHDEQNRPKY